MLIESLIHPKATKKASRTVSAHGQDYEFVQVKPGRYVAEVVEEAAQQAFLKLKHLYREFTEELGAATASLSRAPLAKPTAPTPTVDRAAQQKSAAQIEAEQAAAAEAKKAAENDDPTVNDLDAAARALLSSTPTAIKRQLDKKTPAVDVLKRAEELEKAADTPRQQVLAHLRALIRTAEQE